MREWGPSPPAQAKTNAGRLLPIFFFDPFFFFSFLEIRSLMTVRTVAGDGGRGVRGGGGGGGGEEKDGSP